MASRTWPSVIRIVLVVFVVMTAAGWVTLPVKADSGGTCQEAYGLTPTAVPDWLMPAEKNTDLTTANRYDILAAKLLSSELIDGSACPAKGLNPDGSANACGLELTSGQVNAWQNQFDQMIRASSQTNNLPPKVTKAVIAVESQFWPAGDWSSGEIGLGQMTGYGADLVLMWRPDYYQSICRHAFGDKGCNTQYQFLDSSTQLLLRGLVLKEIDATCPSCVGGVDLEKGKQAVQVLTETLNASCLQSTRVIYLATRKSPAALLSFEDYWRLVLVNYHAGAGCVYQALRKTGSPNSRNVPERNEWDWNSIAANFSSGCASGAEYIRRIEEQIKP
jgi:hypothetical protein